MVILTMYVIKSIYLQEKKRVWVYYVAVLTTVSMGTILIFIGFNLFKNLLSKGKYVFNARMVIFTILIAAPIIFVINFVNTYSDLIEGAVGSVFHRNLNQDKSLDTRTDDLVYGFKASLDDLYAGHGQDYTDFYALTSAEASTNKAAYGGGITNGIIGLFYNYGVCYLILFLGLLFKSAKDLANVPKYTLLIFFTFIGILMVEPIQNSLLIFLILTFYNDKRLLKFS